MKDANFWRSMYKEAVTEAEYWKRWNTALLMLLVIATLAILYLLARG